MSLTWYINPDNGGQATFAEECSEASGGAYTIDTQILPNEADAQREQLVRRLAAGDESVDLMSLDPPFVAEFANAGYLKPVTDAGRRRSAHRRCARRTRWRPPFGTASWWPRRSGPTRSCCGTASRWRRRPASTRSPPPSPGAA